MTTALLRVTQRNRLWTVVTMIGNCHFSILSTFGVALLFALALCCGLFPFPLSNTFQTSTPIFRYPNSSSFCFLFIFPFDLDEMMDLLKSNRFEIANWKWRDQPEATKSLSNDLKALFGILSVNVNDGTNQQHCCCAQQFVK